MVVSLVSVLAVTTARAESPGNAGARPGRVTEGTMFWRTGPEEALVPAPVLKTDVHMVVTGIVARASVRQEFINPGSEWAEGIYVFPLPEDAAVDHLRMQIGDRSIEGVIRERASAKAQYEQAKHEGKRASLVEEERPNIFTTSVANIAPGAAITVEIEYQQAIRYDGGQFRLRFPMVIGPRYIPGTDQVPDASRVTPPVEHPARGVLNPVSLRVELDPGVPWRASTHPTTRFRRRLSPAVAIESSSPRAAFPPTGTSSSCGSPPPRRPQPRHCSQKRRGRRCSRSSW